MLEFKLGCYREPLDLSPQSLETSLWSASPRTNDQTERWLEGSCGNNSREDCFLNSVSGRHGTIQKSLEIKREHLIKELEQVNQEIADVDNRLSQLPSALPQLEAEKQEQARQSYQLHKSIKAVPGSTEADIKEIQDADDIRLCAISVIQNVLGSL